MLHNHRSTLTNNLKSTSTRLSFRPPFQVSSFFLWLHYMSSPAIRFNGRAECFNPLAGLGRHIDDDSTEKKHILWKKSEIVSLIVRLFAESHNLYRWERRVVLWIITCSPRRGTGYLNKRIYIILEFKHCDVLRSGLRSWFDYTICARHNSIRDICAALWYGWCMNMSRATAGHDRWSLLTLHLTFLHTQHSLWLVEWFFSAHSLGNRIN